MSDTGNAIALAASIGSPLTGAVIWLIKWIRESSDRERKTLIEQLEKAAKNVEELQETIHEIETKRLADSKEALATVNVMSHETAKAIRQVAAALNRRR